MRPFSRGLVPCVKLSDACLSIESMLSEDIDSCPERLDSWECNALSGIRLDVAASIPEEAGRGKATGDELAAALEGSK